MNREDPIDFRFCDEATPDVCSECRCVDDEHPLWCPVRRRFRAAEQAAAHHIGSVHEIGPGEA